MTNQPPRGADGRFKKPHPLHPSQMKKHLAAVKRTIARSERKGK